MLSLTTFLAAWALYDGAARVSLSLKDPNSPHGAGVTYCHATPIVKREEAEGCRYVFLTAAHCLESPLASTRRGGLPVTLKSVEVTGTVAWGESPTLQAVQHPEWKEKGRDVALITFRAKCDEGIRAVPIASHAPDEGAVCGILTDHSSSFRNVKRDGTYVMVFAPKINIRVEGQIHIPDPASTEVFFEAIGERPKRLGPGDSGSGMICFDGEKLVVAGVLVKAPHFGSRYGVETGAALEWVKEHSFLSESPR